MSSASHEAFKDEMGNNPCCHRRWLSRGCELAVLIKTLATKKRCV